MVDFEELRRTMAAGTELRSFGGLVDSVRVLLHCSMDRLAVVEEYAEVVGIREHRAYLTLPTSSLLAA